MFNMNPKLKAGCYNSLQRIQPQKGVLWCFMMMNGNWEAEWSWCVDEFKRIWAVKHRVMFDNSWNFRRIYKYPPVNIQKVIENCHLWWIYPWKIVIFHSISYVSLPEGTNIYRNGLLWWSLMIMLLNDCFLLWVLCLHSWWLVDVDSFGEDFRCWFQWHGWCLMQVSEIGTPKSSKSVLISMGISGS